MAERDLTESVFQVSNNQLRWLPVELGHLPKLAGLMVRCAFLASSFLTCIWGVVVVGDRFLATHCQ